MTDLLTDEDLYCLAESVWLNILSTPIKRAETASPVSLPAMMSSVQITGDWEGAIVVACSKALGTHLATQMLGMEPDEIDDEMLRDVMGEIANMTGGSVKGVLPGLNTLTLPTVTAGPPESTSIAHTRVINEIHAECEGDTVQVIVLEKVG